MTQAPKKLLKTKRRENPKQSRSSNFYDSFVKCTIIEAS